MHWIMAHESHHVGCQGVVDSVVEVLWSSVQTQGVGWGWWCSPSIPSFLPFPFPHLSHPYPLVHKSSTQQRHPYGTKPNSFGRSDKQVQHDISMVQYDH